MSSYTQWSKEDLTPVPPPAPEAAAELEAPEEAPALPEGGEEHDDTLEVTPAEAAPVEAAPAEAAPAEPVPEGLWHCWLDGHDHLTTPPVCEAKIAALTDDVFNAEVTIEHCCPKCREIMC